MNSSEEYCPCGTGVSDEDCNNDPQTKLYNYVFAYVYSVTVIVLILFWIVKKKSGFFSCDQCSVGCKSDLYESNLSCLSPKVLLVWRLFMVVVFWIPTTDMLMDDAPFPIRFFTDWNWNLIGLYFVLASYASLKGICSKNTKSEPSILDNLTCILFEIELTAAIMVSCLVWIVLFPMAKGEGRTGSVVNWRSFIVHGVNMISMLTELFLNKVYLRRRGALFFLIWPSIYVFFHTNYMLARDLLPEYKPCPVYAFLSLASPYMIVWFVVLSGASGVAYVFAYKLSQCKMGTFDPNMKKKSYQSGSTSYRSSVENVDTERGPVVESQIAYATLDDEKI